MTPRPAVAVRHATAHPVAFTATAVAVLVTTVLAAAATSFAAAVTSAAVRGSLAASAGSDVLVTTPAGSAAAAVAAGRRVEATLRRALPGLPVAFTSSVRSEDLDLPRAGVAPAGAQARIITLPGLPAHATLTSGSWPASTPAHPRARDVPVAVPATAARLLGLAPGDTVTTRDSVTGKPVTVRVAGVYRRDPGAGRYWSLSPIGPAGVDREGGFSVYGPLVTTPSAARAAGIPVVSAAWLATPAFADLHSGDLTALAGRLSATLGGPGGAGGLAGLPASRVVTSLPALLTQLGTALVVARSQLLIGVLILLVIAGAAVAVSVRLLAGQRDGELALLAARGGARSQLAARGAAEAAMLAVPAALAGPPLGAWLVPLVARIGPLATARLRLAAGIPVTAWAAAAVAAAGCAVIVLLPWLRRPPSPVRQRAARGRQRAMAGVTAAGADLALIALATVAGWQLAHFQSAVPSSLDAALGADPVLVLSPVLMLVAGTVVVLRLLPVATRLADRAAARSRGLSLAVASWQVSRRPLRQAGPVLLAVLAVAAAVITLAEHSSWQRSVADQAAFAAGADVRVTLPPAAPLPMGAVTTLTGAPGVRSATPAITTAVSLPSGQTSTLLALDPAAAAGIVPLRAGLVAGMVRGLAPTAPPSGLAIPGRPARLTVTAALGRGAGGAALAVQVTDARGIGYLVPAGTLPADGRPHRLTALIAPGRHAAYPLRLTGFMLQYTMPLAGSVTQALAIGPVRAAAGTHGPAGPPLPLTRLARQLLARATAQSGGTVRQPPRVTGSAAPSAATLRVTFRPGAGGSDLFGSPYRVQSALSVTADPRITALPGLATAAFLAETGGHVGQTLGVGLNGTTVRVRLDGLVGQFPTLGDGSGLVVDQAALQAVLRAAGSTPLPVTQWWLRTSRAPVLTGLPAGTTFTRRAALARSLSSQPLAAGPQAALLAIAGAALALAVAGFVVSIATARERARDVMLLNALGASDGQVTALLCLHQALLGAAAAGAGLGLGAVLSRLIIPAVSLTAQAAHPVPPVQVLVPWGPAVAIAVAIAAVPVVTAGAATRRRGTAGRLRGEEEA